MLGSGPLATPNQPTNRLTHSLTPWSKVLSEKLTGPQLVKKYSTQYGTPKVIKSNLVHASPPHFLRILSSHLCLGFPNGVFLSDLPTKTLYTLILSLILDKLC